MNPFTNISIRELTTWMRVMKESGNTAKQITDDLFLIDDLLGIQKTHMLLIRKKGLKTQIENRIGVEVGDVPKDMNRK